VISHKPGEPSAKLTDVSTDAFLGGRITLHQPRSGYRAGVDAVLLAAAIPCAPHETVLDVGAGVGTVGLCLAARVAQARIQLLEPASELAALARTNITQNGLEERVRVIEAGIGATAAALEAQGLRAGSCDHVCANPPFHDVGRGTPAHDPLKAASHAMAANDLEAWARFLARMTCPGGRATLIHKAEALGQILQALEGRFGAIRIQPIHARPGAPAIRVLVSGVKASRAPAQLLSGFVLHGAEGNGFTPQATAILRDGQGLSSIR
jgi:tRNA1(Val) A37 N6-methylase TrmN6